MRHVAFAELERFVGEELGVGDWKPIAQERIDAFADATDDHQWIHVDVAAAAASPQGSTIAHGYLTLSLLPALVKQVWQVTGLRMSINAGLDRVRFPAPVPVDSRVRARVVLADVALQGDGSKRVSLDVTVEREGTDKPVCVATTVSRYYPEESRP